MNNIFIWIKKTYTDYLIFNSKTLKIVGRETNIERAIKVTDYLNKTVWH